MPRGISREDYLEKNNDERNRKGREQLEEEWQKEQMIRRRRKE
jgi:hypothetical protein